MFCKMQRLHIPRLNTGKRKHILTVKPLKCGSVWDAMAPEYPERLKTSSLLGAITCVGVPPRFAGIVKIAIGNAKLTDVQIW
jgi:hypothetical protein